MENARICVQVVVLVSGGILSVLGRMNPTTWPSCSLCLAQTSQSVESHPARSSEVSVRWVTVALLLSALVGCREPSVTLVLYTHYSWSQLCPACIPQELFLSGAKSEQSLVSFDLVCLAEHVCSGILITPAWWGLLFFSCSRVES